MDKLLVDANVVEGIFEEINNEDHELTDSPENIFECAGDDYIICIDKGGQIEHEWRGPVRNQWFKNFLSDNFTKGNISIFEANNDERTENTLREMGFPVHSRDVWYVRLSVTLSTNGHSTFLLSEDMDFYEPNKKDKKSGEERHEFMVNRMGDVLKYMSEDHGIEIMPVLVFNADFL